MYAIRSYYGDERPALIAYGLGQGLVATGIELFQPRPQYCQCPPLHLQRRTVADAIYSQRQARGDSNRITSYNVCYTKLLRFAAYSPGRR